MSRRLRRCLSEEDRIDKKIAELLSQKADLEVVRAQEEEKEIVRTIRGMKLEKHELVDLLEGIRKGKVSLLRSDDFFDEDDGSMDAPEEDTGAREDDPYGAPGEEADYGGQTIT